MGVMNERLASYAVTKARNAESQHWRGLLRGYAVTRLPRVGMRTGMQAGACVRACMCVRVVRNRVTA